MVILPKYGSAFQRMKANLGGDKKAEELRQQVLRDQQAALEKVSHPVRLRSRASYRDYPKPKK
jgi:hypothetical protein